ncbi:MAG: hypothetical protein LAO51_17110, partial [Acidobacteriia bacterium]|nr:hypothetical protein [Terriglobia bacterium]
MTIDGTRGASRLGAAGVLAFTMVASGCASSYTLRTTRPDIVLQWPFQPSPAKVTYVRSLNGLSRRRSTGAVLKAAVFGTEKEDRDAFVLPVAAAAGRDGRIAVADMGRRCVHLYLPAQERYLQLFGPDQDRMAAPVAVIFDDGLGLYVSDSTGKVLAYDPDGAL